MVGLAAGVAHALRLEPFGQVVGDVGWAVVGEQTRALVRLGVRQRGGDLHPYRLNAQERGAVGEAQSQVARGEFASDAEMAALW
jgi:hypothetical protein